MAAAAGLVAAAGVTAAALGLRPAIAVPVAGVAALVGAVAPEVRDWLTRHDTNRALLSRLPGADGRPRLPRLSSLRLDQLRVHAASVEVPYVERDVEQQVVAAIQDRRPVLIVGHSMAGKTRLASEVARRLLGNRKVLVAESGQQLQAAAEGNLSLAEAVIWLDDLERFLTVDILSVGLVEALARRRAVLVATIREHALEEYRPTAQLRSRQWDVIQSFTLVRLRRRLSPPERVRVAESIENPQVLSAIDHYGLAEYIGAGPQALDRFAAGETVSRVGYALVRAAVDWRRIGLARPVPKGTLEMLAGHYLEGSFDRDEFDAGLVWATQRINETVALLAPERSKLGHHLEKEVDAAKYEAFDYLVDHVNEIGLSMPDAVWGTVIELAATDELCDIGDRASRIGLDDIAENAYRAAIAAGSWIAKNNLGVLLLHSQDAEAAELLSQAAHRGDAAAMFNFAGHLSWVGQFADAEQWLWKAVNTGDRQFRLTMTEIWPEDATEASYETAAHGGDPDAMNTLGLILHRKSSFRAAEGWLRRAADTGHRGARYNLARLLHDLGRTEQARRYYTMAAAAGDRWAANNLGVLVATTTDDTKRVEEWYRVAAEGGLTQAMVNLAALLISTGRRDEAREWCRRAARAD